MMEPTITDVSIEPCTDSKFIQPYRVNFKQNGRRRVWDCTNVHDSVSILIFNTTRNVFVLVQQFRPAVYMSRHWHLLEGQEIFNTSIAAKAPKTSLDTKASGKIGCTYELCAGIIDKKLTIQQIAQEEIMEETGYKVPLESLECITSFYTSVGKAGSVQTLFYCEVTDDMLEGEGGGNISEGEEILVIHLPLKEGLELVFDKDKPRTSGLLLAMLWFEHYKKPILNI